MARALLKKKSTTGESDMAIRQRSRLMNLNRVLIFALTVSGVLLDGLQLADLLCSLALFVWLWLPLCTRLEAQLLHWVDRDHGRLNRQEHLPPCDSTNGTKHFRSQP
jgi:hypothetical protein